MPKKSLQYLSSILFVPERTPNELRKSPSKVNNDLDTPSNFIETTCCPNATTAKIYRVSESIISTSNSATISIQKNITDSCSTNSDTIFTDNGTNMYDISNATNTSGDNDDNITRNARKHSLETFSTISIADLKEALPAISTIKYIDALPPDKSENDYIASITKVTSNEQENCTNKEIDFEPESHQKSNDSAERNSVGDLIPDVDSKIENKSKLVVVLSRHKADTFKPVSDMHTEDDSNTNSKTIADSKTESSIKHTVTVEVESGLNKKKYDGTIKQYVGLEVDTETNCTGKNMASNKRKRSVSVSPVVADGKLKQTTMLDFLSNSTKKIKTAECQSDSSSPAPSIKSPSPNLPESTKVLKSSVSDFNTPRTSFKRKSTTKINSISNSSSTSKRIFVNRMVNGKKLSFVPVIQKLTNDNIILIKEQLKNGEISYAPDADCSEIIASIQKLNAFAKKVRAAAALATVNQLSVDKLSKKLKNVKDEEYVVERIEKINEIKTVPHFFIKWKGYSATSSTWEPLDNVRDCNLINEFLNRKSWFYRTDITSFANEMNQNQMANANQSPAIFTDDETFKQLANFDEHLLQCDLILLSMIWGNGHHKTKAYDVIYDRAKKNLQILPFYMNRIEQLDAISKFERQINNTDKSSNLTVENLVDYEGPPSQFTYINDVIPGEGVTIPDDPPIGCECENGCFFKTQCCGKKSGSSFAYNCKKRIRVPPGTPVFECNKRCKCGPECMNRVVQQGRKHSLCIFKTPNGCGWGVRTLRTIYEGQYICEYVGEIITYEETERRGQIYDAQGRTYLFDLDMNSSDNPYTIDAAHHGNVSHFINHSCDPNCGVWAVWINCLDLDLPKICLFALRRIEAGEELSFDYINQNANGRSADQSSDENEIDIVASTNNPTIAATTPDSVHKIEIILDNSDETRATTLNEKQDTDLTNSEKLDLDENQKEDTIIVSNRSPFPKRIAKTMECRCGSIKCRKYLF